jgi:hypothetical protein
LFAFGTIRGSHVFLGRVSGFAVGFTVHEVKVKSLLLVVVTYAVSLPAHAQENERPPDLTLLTNSNANVALALGDSMQIFHLDSADAMGMKNVPDQHTCIVQQPDSSYQVYITGVIGTGDVALLTTRDFLHYTPLVGTLKRALPVFGPSCSGNPDPDSCAGNYDADYAGANLVYRSANGKDLLMLYYAGSNSINDWAEMALARSTDDGRSWTRVGPVISGTDPKPTTPISSSVLGVVEGGAIISNGYIYAYYSYFPNPDAPDSGRPTIQVARAPVSGDGMPGTWTKYFNGSFGTEPGLGGRGSQVVPSIPGNLRPAQPWPAYSQYLKAYILIFIAEDGWFFSTSSDLLTWSQPTLFYAIKTFQDCQPNDDNVVLVTPGNPGQVLGKTGLALYSHTPHWGFKTCPTVQYHELWVRPFTFSLTTTGVESRPAALPSTAYLEQNYPNPFNPTTEIRYQIPAVSGVRLGVYDLLGREVAVLVNEIEPPGSYTVKFDGTGLPSGMYFYRLEAGGFTMTRSLCLIR